MLPYDKYSQVVLVLQNNFISESPLINAQNKIKTSIA